MSGISTYILCLLIGIAVPLVALLYFVKRGANQLSAADAYKAVANRLDLNLDTRGIGLQGFHQGRHLWVGQVLLGAERRTEIQGVLGLRTPIGYGLTMQSRRRKRTGGLKTNDEDFDKLFFVNAVYTDAASELFNDVVRGRAIELHSICSDVQISDELIRIKLSSPEKNAEKLEAVVSAMITIAEALEGQRAQVGHAAELNDRALEWHAYAEANGYDYHPEGPCISAINKWGQILITPRWTGSEFVSELKVFFNDAVDTGFRLTPQRGPSVPWLTGQDIEVRDSAFDKAFVIKGYHPADIRTRLHAEARTLLLDLLKSGPFEATDDWIRVPSAPLEIHSLKRVIQQTEKAAEILFRKP